MLEDLTPPPKIAPCMIRTVMRNLDESDQTILKNALADRDAWSNRGLAKALTDKGLPIGERLIRSRRNKPCDDCVCR
jgi:hypothetical protein